MALPHGTRIGHYEITSLLGKGGMGEVYRARDSKLHRDVALKVLPPLFAGDRDRLSRFEREARVLASLNHAGIAQIYGIEERALVMELVEGKTLGERIKRGPMPLEDALPIATAIAEALEYAHERGIVHRDLKPANVKVTPGGQVKVLDFGLAKLVVEGTGGANLSDSPTITMPATHAGVVLGTAAYMAPEQAKGHPIDRRADIFSFGCVLYEMLSGRRAFDGESVPDIISRVLQLEPDWTQLPVSTPPSVHRLMRLCLEKDPRKRRQSAGDVRIDLEQALTELPTVSSSVSPRRPGLTRLTWIASAVVLIAALAIPAIIHLREAPSPEVELQIATPPTLRPMHFALSPDGRYIVFVASASRDAPQRLYLRALDNPEPRPMAGTDGAQYPFWSPDSRSVGFFASEKLFRIDISGGPPQPLATAINPQGGAWSEDGTILFSPNTVSPLFRVSASGGPSLAATELDRPHQTAHMRPSFLPGGRQFLFYAQGEAGMSGIHLGQLDGEVPKRLTDAASAAYLEPDHIVFVQDGALVARRFDAARGELTGDPLTLAASVGQGTFSTSATGILAYRPGGGTQTRMTWFDRMGREVKEEDFNLNAPDLSTDGRYLAYDRTIQGNRDVWFMDLERGGDPTRFTNHLAIDGFPVWSPNGAQIVFHSQRNGTFDIWIKPFSGAADTERLLHGTPDNEWPLDWSNDGRFLLFQRSDPNYVSSDLWALPMTGEDRTPIAVANTPFEERMGEFSPDGHWIVYETDESGRREIKVQAFPESRGIVYPVSTGGGAAPRWSADGTSIYFTTEENVMVVPVTIAGPMLKVGKPLPALSAHVPSQTFRSQYVLSRDGRLLVGNTQVDEVSASPITLILNWKP
jgi:serine/threonine protein kinase